MRPGRRLQAEGYTPSVFGRRRDSALDMTVTPATMPREKDRERTVAEIKVLSCGAVESMVKALGAEYEKASEYP